MIFIRDNLGLLPKFTNITLPHLRRGNEVKGLLFHRKFEECSANEILLPAISGNQNDKMGLSNSTI